MAGAQKLFFSRHYTPNTITGLMAKKNIELKFKGVF